MNNQANLFPPDMADVVAMTQCADCDKLIQQSEAVQTATEDFCSNQCKENYLLSRLRREGW